MQDEDISLEDYRWFMKQRIQGGPVEAIDPEGRNRYNELEMQLKQTTDASDGQARTAIHEAAHAVVAHRLGYKTSYIEIRDDDSGEAPGVEKLSGYEFRDVLASDFDHATTRVAGQVAEEIGWTYARKPEHWIGRETANSYVKLRMWPVPITDVDSAELLRVAPGATIEDRIIGFIESAERRAEAILRENWPIVERIARDLRQRHRIDGPDLEPMLADVDFGRYEG